MKTVSMGTKKKQYKSIKMAAQAAGISYITYYMRLRMGTKPATAAKKPVRKYEKRNHMIDNEGNPFMVRQ